MSEYPKQKDKIRRNAHPEQNREAIAPYNFVELPDRVVKAKEADGNEQVRLIEDGKTQFLVRHDCYFSGRHTGHITATLVADSPLYIRTGLSPEAFAAIAATPFHEMSEEQKKQYAQFFALHGGPAIPGSSLRGMFRTLVEIATYGKVTRVMDSQRFFFRAVAAEKTDPLSEPYKQKIKKVKAGYLVYDKGKWYIRPATPLNNQTYLWVRQNDACAGCSMLKQFDHAEYHPLYIEVSFEETFIKNGKHFARGVQEGNRGTYQGVLVTSGNMKETGSVEDSPRRNHCIVLPANQDAERIEIDNRAVEDYRNGLTAFQKEQFSDQWGFMQHDRPVFYVPPQKNKPVIYFGQSPNFRIPYRYKGSEHASSPRDFVPEDLRDPNTTDLAEAMFGYVPDDNNDKRQAYAGRVFFDDAPRKLDKETLTDTAYMTPRILASPKPTTFQHYLVQEQDERQQLKHYASKPGEETVIRGHKLYWHQGHVNNEQWKEHIQEDPQKDVSHSTQHTGMQPLAPGTEFAVTIRFENLSDVELGALLWLVQLAGNEKYRLKLGMGKPLGMGSVRLQEAQVIGSQRAQRYGKLFDDQGGWATGETQMTEEEQKQCIAAFQEYVREQSGVQAPSFDELPRMMMLKLLSWPGPSHDHRYQFPGGQSMPPQDRTRYMEIGRPYNKGYISDTPKKGKTKKQEKVNEYANRPVLPGPWQVLGEDAPRRYPLAQPASPEPTTPPPDGPRTVIDTRKVGTVEAEATGEQLGEIIDVYEEKKYYYQQTDVVGKQPVVGQKVRFFSEKRKKPVGQGRRQRTQNINCAIDIEPVAE